VRRDLADARQASLLTVLRDSELAATRYIFLSTTLTSPTDGRRGQRPVPDPADGPR